MHCTSNIQIKPGNLAVVVGAGASGLAAAKLLKSMGLKIRLLEKTERQDLTELALKEDWEIQFGDHRPEQFKDASIIVPSPGLALSKLLSFLPQGAEKLVLGEMELAFRQVNEPIIAITGTSGKTTTASLCAAMLEVGGKKVFLGGNIGTPLSEYVLSGEKADVLVLEISSFQLQTCNSFHAHVAMLLNLSENHLDYHADFQEYEDAKFNLFRYQNKTDYAIFPKNMADNSRLASIEAEKIFFEPGQDFKDTSLLGKHNQDNLAAAWQAALLFGVNLADAQRAAKNFKAIEHRLELVGEKNGVLFINDSKSTTVDSLRVALEAMDRPVLLLAGGVFKGGDLTTLAPLIKQKVKAIGLFGASRDIFESAWLGLVPISWSEKMEDTVANLLQEASSGEVLLLSPGTASFDLYTNYKARDNDFKRIWENLQ